MTVHWEHPDDPRLFLRSAYIRAAGNRQFHAPPIRGTRGSHRNLRIAHPDPPPRPRPLRAVAAPTRHCHGCGLRWRSRPGSAARWCPDCVAGRRDIAMMVVALAAMVVVVSLIMWAVSGG